MLLLVNKPKGITSFGVVREIRKITDIKKVGHAGTLDPNATGLLIVGIGRESTKKLGGLLKDTSKKYDAEIILGELRDTDDVEGKVISKSNYIPSKAEVESAINKYRGTIEQIPPQFSAIKKSGKKAYSLARKGVKVPLEPRKVVINSLEMELYKYPLLKLSTEASSGTYIRSLARDIGNDLGTHGYLNNLVRTQIGEYKLDIAHHLDEVTKDNWRSLCIK